jgi:hypothetical protein
MLRSGFFNSFFVNGEYDRKYNADDYSANMGALIRSGVLRDANNGFRVTASGLVLSVSPGRAWIEGRWAHLDTVHTFTAIVPPVGDYSRIDSVSLQLDTNVNSRQISFVYKEGTPASTPVAPPVVRADGIYEICLARIWVNPNARNVSVTDCRPIQDLCGWVTTPVGYDEFFASFDAEFNEWFAQKRTTLAVNTLYKQYMWRTVLSASANAVSFDIPQHNSDGVDIIQVFVNGLLETEGADYTLNGNVITFKAGGGATGTKVAGTEIVVICYKSIDGTGLGSVSNELTDLQNRVAALADYTDYNYVCTGLNDNVALSQIAQDFLSGPSDSKIMTIRVYGTMGVTAAYAGSGTSVSPYRWFQFGKDDVTEWTSRRVIVDFCNTNFVYINCPAQSNNVLFYGNNVDVKNARFDIKAEGGFVVGFNSDFGKVYADKCWIRMTGSSYTYFAKIGTFTDCYVDVRNTAGNASVFRANNTGITRIRGGEYRAYCTEGFISAPIRVLGGQPNSIVIADACSLPVYEVAGYKQTHGVFDESKTGYSVYRDIITTLPCSAQSQAMNIIGKNIRDQV